MAKLPSSLPLVLAGPILRRTETERLAIWMVVSKPVDFKITFNPKRKTKQNIQHLKAGDNLHYLLIDLQFNTPLPQDKWIGYKIELKTER
jgi:hypothetical protein